MRVFFLKKSNAMRIALFAVIMVLAVVYAETGAELPVFGETVEGPVCSVETDERVVALTFDTTFGTDYTHKVRCRRDVKKYVLEDSTKILEQACENNNSGDELK